MGFDRLGDVGFPSSMRVCDVCRSKFWIRDRLTVVDRPPTAFVDGEKLDIGITGVRLLERLVQSGQASRDSLTQIGVGPQAGLRTLDVQINRVRVALQPFGIGIRAIPKWGFELHQIEKEAPEDYFRSPRGVAWGDGPRREPQP